MEWTSLILDFLARIAWPALLAAGLWILRKPIRTFAENATEITFAGVTMRRAAENRAHILLEENTSMSETTAPEQTSVRAEDLTEPLQRVHDWAHRYFDSLDASHVPASPWSAVMRAGDAVNGLVAFAEREHVDLDSSLLTRVNDVVAYRQDTVGGRLKPTEKAAAEYVEAARALFLDMCTSLGIDPREPRPLTDAEKKAYGLPE